MGIVHCFFVELFHFEELLFQCEALFEDLMASFGHFLRFGGVGADPGQVVVDLAKDRIWRGFLVNIED